MNTHRAPGGPQMPGVIVRDPEVRAWLYTVATALLPILVALGLVTAEHGGLWLALVGAILGTPALALARLNTPSSSDQD